MARVVHFHRTGGPEVLQIEELEVGEPGPNEMRVGIEAIGLNRAEALFRSGAYLEQPRRPARIGYEASAIVEKLGGDVRGFKPGDKVSVIPAFSMNDYGVYAEETIVPAAAVVARPPGTTAIEAAAVWMAYLTAYGALIDIAKLAKGDHVIITAASSSVGVAAIQIANSLGAIPIATTRTNGKKEALKTIGAAHVVVTSEQNLVAEVMQVTDGAGARVTFDPIAGAGVLALADAARRGGILVLYGWLSRDLTPFPLAAAMRKALTFRGYTLFELTRDSDRLKRAEEFITRGLAGGKLKPVIAKVFPFDRIVDAHRYLESNEQLGKIIVTVP
ncbi:MAG: zinc-dependent alcohol dehydrogenase family protein [Methyloceanibacter sp.]